MFCAHLQHYFSEKPLSLFSFSFLKAVKSNISLNPGVFVRGYTRQYKY